MIPSYLGSLNLVISEGVIAALATVQVSGRGTIKRQVRLDTYVHVLYHCFEWRGAFGMSPKDIRDELLKRARQLQAEQKGTEP